jgi:glycosyltransferase involved in cell wall biosynthesis
MLEAMACGCAVVSTDCGGPSDVIEHGVNGLLCEVGNVGGIIHSIRTLYENDELRKSIALNGLETAKRYSWDNAIELFERTLYEVSDRS